MKVLFVCHDASRTGAPILLLTFLRWLVREGSVNFEVLLIHDGPLRRDFEAVCSTTTVDALTGRSVLSAKLGRRFLGWDDAHWIDKCVRSLANRRYDCVYGNSIVSLPWLEAFKRRLGVATLCHIHEMAWGIERSFTPDRVRAGFSCVDVVVACSPTVERDLRETFGVTTPIRVARAFVEPDAALRRRREDIRDELGLSPGTFLVGGVGRAEFRKGVDLLVLLLRRLTANSSWSDYHAVWVGHTPADESMMMCRHDVRKLGLDDRFSFVPQTLHPNDYINAFDCFAMTSREDPMPLVALAAASLGRPIVTFATSGGIEEVVEDGCGYSVPYLDVEAMADVIDAVRQDPAEAGRRGSAARDKVRRSYSLEKIAPELLESLVLASRQVRPS